MKKLLALSLMSVLGIARAEAQSCAPGSLANCPSPDFSQVTATSLAITTWPIITTPGLLPFNSTANIGNNANPFNLIYSQIFLWGNPGGPYGELETDAATDAVFAASVVPTGTRNIGSATAIWNQVYATYGIYSRQVTAGAISSSGAAGSTAALGWNCSGGSGEACIDNQGSAGGPQGFSVYQETSANTLSGATKIFGVDKTGAMSLPTGGGIVGVTDGSNAPAGDVGEAITGSVASVAIPAAAYAQVLAVTLTPGDWDCSGDVGFPTMSTASYNTQTFLSVAGSSSPIANTQNIIAEASGTLTAGAVLPTGVGRQNISSSESLSLMAYTVYASTANGTILCRRMR